MTDPLCYLNGAILPLREAKVGVLDLGILRGFGIYEGITSFSGEPFRLSDHWERFQKSADVLGLVIPRTQEEVANAMRALIKHNTTGTRASLRMLLTGGEALDGLEYVPGRETFFITAAAHTPLPRERYERGASLITHEYQRFLPEIKTIHYITAVTLQKKRRAAGALEILYTSDGKVLECSTSNIFIVKDGIIRTPDADVLKGITRKVVLELAHKAYPVQEMALALPAFFDADEAFITSSFKDIVPVISVDGRTIGSGIPGPITRDLMARFAQYTDAAATEALIMSDCG
ncbi:MAG: aminotransferase class IV [Minisyncoccota bacterium]